MSQIPELKKAIFEPKHTLINLNDGTFVPSPAFGAGTAMYNKNDDKTTEAVVSALKNGYRHLDNAYVYGNQESVGKAIAQAGVPREDLYITSKYWPFDKDESIPKDGTDLDKQIESTLKDLGVKYLDLFLIHHPLGIDISKYWARLEEWKEKGILRSIGVSNFSKENLQTVLNSAKYKPVVNQIEFHPYIQKEKKPALDFAAENDIVTAAYSALTPITKKPDGPVDAIVTNISKQLNITPSQVLLDWVKAKNILDITTSRTPQRQIEQLATFESKFPSLSKDQVEVIDKAGAEINFNYFKF